MKSTVTAERLVTYALQNSEVFQCRAATAHIHNLCHHALESCCWTAAAAFTSHTDCKRAINPPDTLQHICFSIKLKQSNARTRTYCTSQATSQLLGGLCLRKGRISCHCRSKCPSVEGYVRGAQTLEAHLAFLQVFRTEWNLAAIAKEIHQKIKITCKNRKPALSYKTHWKYDGILKNFYYMWKYFKPKWFHCCHFSRRTVYSLQCTKSVPNTVKNSWRICTLSYP